MQNALLFAWELAVAASCFGVGIPLARLCGLRRTPLAISGIVGVSAWIALGGVLNLTRLLIPGLLATLTLLFAAVGVFCLLQPDSRASFRQGVTSVREASLIARLLLVIAAIMIGTMILAGSKTNFWSIDDLEGYLGLAIKALQKHSIQPDPFCERRVQAGVGGANFLQSWMYTVGDVRAMAFIDSGLGVFLYAASLWALARRWRLSLGAAAFCIVCLPFATLMKVNTTVVYLAAAGFFVVLFLTTEDQTPEEGIGGWTVLVGLVAGGILTTKTTNITLILPFLCFWSLLRRKTQPTRYAFLPALLILAVALAVALPYALTNKAISGTYMYPLFGLGTHATAYGVPKPSQVGSPLQEVLIATPNLLFLGVALLCCWKLTSQWGASARAGLLTFFASSMVAEAATIYGVGGSGGDRYSAPLVMPAILIMLVVALRAQATPSRVWYGTALASLASIGVYTIVFLGHEMHWYVNYRELAFDSVNALPEYSGTSRKRIPPGAFKEQIAYGHRLQSATPPGSTVIADVENSAVFDFQRNTIYIQDMAGMASPPPGLPLLEGQAAIKQFLLNHDVRYIVLDRKMLCGKFGSSETMHPLTSSTSDERFLHSPYDAHDYNAWANLEKAVACFERKQLSGIASTGQAVYDDGRFTVSRIR